MSLTSRLRLPQPLGWLDTRPRRVQGDKWRKLETETIDDIDKGSVMRNHEHLMRPARPDEEDDLRVGVLLYADEVETVEPAGSNSHHALHVPSPQGGRSLHSVLHGVLHLTLRSTQGTRSPSTSNWTCR